MFLKLKRKAPKTGPREGKEFYDQIEDVARILDVKVPEIIWQEYVFNNGENIMGFPVLYENEVPEGVQSVGAWYSPDKKIIMSQKHDDVDMVTGERKFYDYTTAEHIFIMSHELRHVWQDKNENKKYFEKNANGLETIEDIAEVDADAFAMAYLMQKSLKYRPEDLPFMLDEFTFSSYFGRGNRWKRA